MNNTGLAKLETRLILALALLTLILCACSPTGFKLTDGSPLRLSALAIVTLKQ